MHQPASNDTPPTTRLLTLLGSQTVRHLFSKSSWSVCGAVILQGMTFAAYIMAARLVGKETFGEFGLVKSTATTFATYALFGMGIVATKYIPEWLHSNKQNVGRLIALNYAFTTLSGLIFALALYLGAPWICEHALGRPSLIGPFRSGAFLIFLIAVMTSQVGVLAGFQNFKAIAITSSVAGLLTVPIYACGALYGGVYGLILAAIVTTCVNILLNACFVAGSKKTHGIVYTLRGWKSIFPILWKFGLPSALNGLLGAPALWICYLLLTRQPQGIAEVAVLTACMQLYLITIFIQGQTWKVFLTQLSEAVGQGDKKKFFRIVKLSLCLNVAMALVVVVPLMLLSPILLGLYGPGFVSGVRVFVTLGFSSIAFSLFCVSSQILTSQGKAWQGFAISSCGCLTMLTVSSILVARGYGAWGVAIAHLSSYTLQCLLSFLYLCRSGDAFGADEVKGAREIDVAV